MKKLYFILALLSISLYSSLSYAQCPINGFPDPAYFDLSTAGTHPDYTLKLYFNVVRDDNGDHGYDFTRLPIMEGIIDGAFNQHGIFFEYVCENIPVDNSDLATIATGGSLQPGLFCAWESETPSILHPDGIDIFIVHNFAGGTGFTGAAGRVNDIPGKFMVISNNSSVAPIEHLETTTLIHELGHIFGLTHMHRGATENPANYPAPSIPPSPADYCTPMNSGGPCDYGCPKSSLYNCNTGGTIYDINACAESSINGATAGDLIPDTPPSYYKAEKVNSNCQFDNVPIVETYWVNGSMIDIPILDPLGNSYAPDVTNYMATLGFNNNGCRDHFTPNQVTVMKNHIATHPTLAPFHSIKGPLACDCDYEKIIYLRDDISWSTVISQYNLDPLNIQAYEIVVEATLTMDVDYNYNGINFTMGPDAEIDIISGADIAIQKDNNDKRSVLMACGARWRGIKVEGGASLSFTDSDIYETLRAIDAENGSSLVIDNIVAIGAANNAIRIIGNVPMTYDKVKVIETHVAVFIADSPQFYDLKNTEVHDANAGIVLNNASASITFLSTDHDVGVPVFIDQGHGSVVAHCELGYEFFGMMISNTNTGTIEDNIIGKSTITYGDEGISIFNSSFLKIRNNPVIRAHRFGIRGVNLNTVQINKNADISISGQQNTMSAGISLTMANDCDILDNFIYASEVGFGIETNNSFLNSIRNNYVSISSIPNLFRSSAIRTVGCLGEEIIDNETYSSDNGNGILVQNSTDGTYICNYVYLTHDGLSILHNSASQEIIGNHLISSHNLDFITRSRLGIQGNHGNEFWGGSVRGFFNTSADLMFSRFLVDADEQYHMPSDPVPAMGWFMDNNQIDEECSGSPGPGGQGTFFSDPTRLCDYWDDIKPLKNTDPELFIIKVSHIIRYFDIRPWLTMPDCIKLDPIFINLCGLHAMMDVVDRISKNGEIDPTRASLQLEINDLLALHEAYIAATDPVAKATQFNAIATKYAQSKPAFDQEAQADALELQTIKGDLAVINCPDYLINLMKSVWMAYIDELGIDRLEHSPKIEDHISTASELCSDEYGDAVHLARSIASLQGSDTYFDAFDGCGDTGGGLGSSKKEDIQVDEILMEEVVMNIAPNPSAGNVHIAFNVPVNGKLQVYDMKGNLAHTQEVSNENALSLDIETRGVYIIRFIQENGHVISNNAVVIK